MFLISYGRTLYLSRYNHCMKRTFEHSLYLKRLTLVPRFDLGNMDQIWLNQPYRDCIDILYYTEILWYLFPPLGGLKICLVKLLFIQVLLLYFYFKLDQRKKMKGVNMIKNENRTFLWSMTKREHCVFSEWQLRVSVTFSGWLKLRARASKISVGKGRVEG